MKRINRVRWFSAAGVIGASLIGFVALGGFNAEQHLIASTPSAETSPTLGNDGVSDLVVFTELPPLPGGAVGPGDIWYQRLNSDGSPMGSAVQVTTGPTDDRLNDVSGDYIVYTAFVDEVSPTGSVVAYQISSGQSFEIAQADIMREPRIHGSRVVWREGRVRESLVMFHDLAWLGTSQDPIILAGPGSVFSVDIGDGFVVWTEEVAGQFDVVAYDYHNDIEIQVTNTAGVDEQEPSTSGPWVVFQSQSHPIPNSVARIEGKNLDTGELRVLVDNGALNLRPAVQGSLVSFDSNSTGPNLDVLVYRLDHDDVFQVTDDPGAQLLNDVFGDLVAFVGIGTDSLDMWVAKLSFPEPDIEVFPLAVDFGEVEVGSSSTAIITVSNVGEVTAGVDSVSLPGAPADCAIASPLPGDLPRFLEPEETLDITVVFTPLAEGPGCTEELWITSDDPEQLITIAFLTGTGVSIVLPPGEQIQAILDFFDDAVAAGTLTGDGPNAKSAAGRRGALRNMLVQAGVDIANNDIAAVCIQLADALKRTDGVFPPPDFVAGEAADELAGLIAELRDTLGCE